MPLVKDHFFNSFDGRTIYVKEKLPSDHCSSKIVLCLPPCLYPHAVFDCPISDYSLMDYLAEKGFRVFTYDPRGFGKSYHPTDGKNVTFDAECQDAEALVRFIQSQSGTKLISIGGSVLEQPWLAAMP